MMNGYYIGDTEISDIYLGSELIYSSQIKITDDNLIFEGDNLKSIKEDIINKIKKKSECKIILAPTNKIYKDIIENLNSIENEKKYILPNVTSLGVACFDGCTSLTNISLPKTKILGDACFIDCTSLKDIYLPNVTTLRSSCFVNCKSLTGISLPNAATLGDSCFSNCTSLTDISLPNVTALGVGCFKKCTSLTDISLPNVTALRYSCFNSCESLRNVFLPSIKKLDIDETGIDRKATIHISRNCKILSNNIGSKIEYID